MRLLVTSILHGTHMSIHVRKNNCISYTGTGFPLARREDVSTLRLSDVTMMGSQRRPIQLLGLQNHIRSICKIIRVYNDLG